jgi:hypothetical protein
MQLLGERAYVCVRFRVADALQSQKNGVCEADRFWCVSWLRSLFSFAGGLRTLGSTSAKASCFSTQGFDGEPGDRVAEVNIQVPEFPQSSSDATPEFFSFDSPAASGSATSADQLDQPAAQPHDIYSSGRSYQPRGVYKVLKPGCSEVSYLMCGKKYGEVLKFLLDVQSIVRNFSG